MTDENEETYSVLKTFRITPTDQEKLEKYKILRGMGEDSEALRTMIRESAPA